MQQLKNNSYRASSEPIGSDPATIAERIGLTCRNGSISWLEASDSGNRQAIINAAWQDMRARYRNGEQVRADDYFVQDDSNVDESLAVDIVYAEYVLRLEWGESPKVAEYTQRFPRFAVAIRRQLEVHEGMDSSEKGSTWDLTPESDVALAEEQIPATAPTKVGKYLLLSKLSSGGQAAVYRAVHPTLGRDLVVKIAHRPLGEGASVAARLLDEGRILAELDHPNLARVYDMGIDSGHPYLAMEYVRGRTLDQYAKEETLTWHERARMVAEVAAAVSAAHRKNVVHLDIKPRNIVVDEHGSPRLLDFGLARIFDAFREKSAKSDISGTLRFMAPEQARGDGEAIGRRTDIFGLGGVLYFLLTHKAPFSGENIAELLPLAAKGEWDRQPLSAASIPSPLRAICTRAMAPNLEDRFGSADELAAALRRFTRSVRLTRLLRKAAMFLVPVLAVMLLIGRHWLTPSEIAPTLDADVRQTDGHYTELANALPLRNGDQLRFHADIPAGSHAGLFVFTSLGELHVLGTWQPQDEARQLNYPTKDNEAVPLDGNAGTEFVFLCTSAKGPATLDEVRDAWKDSRPLEALPDYTVAMIDSKSIRFDNFGKGLGPVIQNADPESAVKQRLEPVLKLLGEMYPGVAGIAFTHKR